MPARKMRIDGAEHPYFAQVFWAGLATAPLLPSTVAPVGFDAHGLPVGLQIVGPEFGDLGTIWLAGELGRLIGGYRPPPGY
jgi:amidase